MTYMKNWSIPVTMQNAIDATADGQALDTSNLGGASIQLSGTFSATVTFEGTTDGLTWVAILATNRTTGSAATTTTAAGIFFIAAQGLVKVRARVSAYTSGNVTAVGVAVPVESAL
jgi:hypothetical protein